MFHLLGESYPLFLVAKENKVDISKKERTADRRRRLGPKARIGSKTLTGQIETFTWQSGPRTIPQRERLRVQTPAGVL